MKSCRDHFKKKCPTDRPPDIQTELQTDRKTNWQTDGPTHRPSDWHTDKLIELIRAAQQLLTKPNLRIKKKQKQKKPFCKSNYHILVRLPAKL